jgi:hypothetical protein
MNDNRDRFTGVQIHLPAYFYVNETWFEFFRQLPDFNVIDVHDRHVTAGRLITIQIADRHSFLHVTAYRFFAP